MRTVSHTGIAFEVALTIVSSAGLLVIIDERAQETKFLHGAIEFLGCDLRIVHGQRCERSKALRVV